MMKEVIPPIDKATLIEELTEDKFLRKTNNASNELYIVDCHNSPNLVKEIGRLREITFRAAGGGTGKDCDLDEYDLSDNPYQQLLVWDPQRQEILGGYRFIIGNQLPTSDNPAAYLATSHMFQFSEAFINDYLPYTIELGRSFVQPAYQSTQKTKKGLYALDNLWDGLGAIWVNNRSCKYFFGKVTMYTSFNTEARNLILYFLNKHFGDRDQILWPIEPLDTGMDIAKMQSILGSDDYPTDLKKLSQEVRARGEVIPPLINAYINLSPTMKVFGTSLNDEFGDVEETAIMVTVEDMYEAKTERHIESYIRQLNEHKDE